MCVVDVKFENSYIYKTKAMKLYICFKMLLSSNKHFEISEDYFAYFLMKKNSFEKILSMIITKRKQLINPLV